MGQLSRDEREEKAKELYKALIDVCNSELMPLHHEDKLDAAEVVYIASAAICRAAATVLFGNQQINHNRVETVMASFIRLFKQCAKTVIEDVEEEEPKTATGAVSTASSDWD